MMLTDEPDPHHSSLLGVSTIQLTGSVPIRINSGQGGGGSLSVAYQFNQSNHVKNKGSHDSYQDNSHSAICQTDKQVDIIVRPNHIQNRVLHFNTP